MRSVAREDARTKFGRYMIQSPLGEEDVGKSEYTVERINDFRLSGGCTVGISLAQLAECYGRYGGAVLYIARPPLLDNKAETEAANDILVSFRSCSCGQPVYANQS